MFQNISFLVCIYQDILSVSLPLKKPWNNFPTYFPSSLYKLFYCVHHCNIMWYFQ